MKRRGFHLVVAVLAVCLLASTHAFAQGGGASTTGSINGKVADTSGGVLPGVTVSATSPSSMGVQSSVTDTGGNYRFPALPPGTYTVTFELPGFNTLKRENIQISMGFSATVNVELAVASLQETVTVTGDSPVIDTSNTRVQQNFKLEALQEIPNSRDLWSLLAVTPVGDDGPHRRRRQPRRHADRLHRVRLQRPEPRARRGHQHDRRHRAAPASTSTTARSRRCSSARSARAPRCRPRACRARCSASRAATSSRASSTTDYETNGMIGENISKNVPAKFLYDPVTNPGGNIRPHSNETSKYRDIEHQRRRPDQEGQGVVVLLVPQPEDLGRPAELHRPDRRHELRHQAVEPVRQGDLPDQPEQQVDRLLPVGPEGAAEPPAAGGAELRLARRHAEADLRQLDLQG